MNKKKLVVIGGILLIGISSVVVLNMDTGINSSIDRRTNREKQRDYLKERETEILQKIQKRYPKIESVQFDWNAFTINPISNGWITTKGYNMSLRGKFNHLENTDIEINFYLEHSKDIPDIEGMGMHHHPMIKVEWGWEVYD